MTQQHKHLIVRADISWCPQEEDLNKISDWIRSLIKKIDMNLVTKLVFGIIPNENPKLKLLFGNTHIQFPMLDHF